MTVVMTLLGTVSAAALGWSFLTPRPGRADSTEIDPQATTALTSSVDYLRSLPEFSVDATVTYDEVVHGDFNVQRTGKVHVSVRRPDRMRAEISGDMGTRLFVYDGKTLSLYLAKEQYYASVPAPATLRETLDMAIQKHAIELPLTDVLYAAMGGDLQQNIRAAGVIGPTAVGDAQCLQLAFRGMNVDWQIWLAQGAKPLPCKFAITTTSLPTRPQYTAVLTWQTSAAISDDAFKFTPPPGAKPIRLGSASTSAN